MNRLKRRAAAKAEEVKTQSLTQNQIAEKPYKDAEKARHVSEQHNIDAAKANLEVQEANAKAEKADRKLAEEMAEAEKGYHDWDFAIAMKEIQDTSPSNSEHRHTNNSFRCTFCRVLFVQKEKFQEHQKEDWHEKSKCHLWGNKLTCMLLRKHMKDIHGKNLQWIVKDY